MLSQGQGVGGGVSSCSGDTIAAQRASAARKSGIINHAASSTSSGGGSAVSGSDLAGGPSSGDVSISSPRFAVSIVSSSARFFCELHAPRYGRASGELKLTHSARRTRENWPSGQRPASRRSGDERRHGQRRSHEGKPIPCDGSMPTLMLRLLPPLGCCNGTAPRGLRPPRP